ncbi:MAG: DEAD/DEAH box helicase [Deltaproteobacteria bacterium]|nr:DEAD/DEAH box helicase [Deltaproteobacteria bacterium]
MTRHKRYYRGPRKSPYKKGRTGVKKGLYERPRLDPQLRPAFKKIGIPEAAPFNPDPFQIEALKKLQESDVLVSAPTGAGKTWIASQAIHTYLAEDRRVWYASPLKALSNSIYQEFCHEFGHEQIGILTGDRKEKPNAPVIVGTTEILRNQLYDAMHEGTSVRADLVILDEAHYLSDPDRGVVWEEVLIYLPSRVRLLLLSATISNAEEVSEWLEQNRGTRARVVRSNKRPVPLETLFLFPDGLISPLAGRKGLTPVVRKFLASGGGKRGMRRLDFGGIIKCLRELDLLPAIFFLKSRMDCNRALLSCTSPKIAAEAKDRMKWEVRGFLRDYPHLRGHKQMAALMESMVGAHHAGQLPYWKALVEKMMKNGRLEAIFSTSTVAAGVNFPARTVVLVQSDRFNGHGFADLTATELHQMIGRAGRRGKDNIGFALVVPGVHQDPQLIHELEDSPPEPIMSRIHINFSMTLNLLLSHRPLEVEHLLVRSFAAFQEKGSGSTVEKRWNEALGALKAEIPRGRCDTGDPSEVIENIQKRSEFQKEAGKLRRVIRKKRRIDAYGHYLTPGRLFLHKKGGTYLVFHSHMEHGTLICASHNINKPIRTRKNRIRLRKVPVEKIEALFDYQADIPEGHSFLRLQGFLDALSGENLKILRPKISKDARAEEDIMALKKRVKALPCEDCEHLKECHSGKSKDLKRILRDYRSLASHMEGMGKGLWPGFMRHVRFLKETGFVDETDHLTPDGYWASKLRLDQPLLIAEAIIKGAFDGVSPEVMGACMAPFVWDRDQELETKAESPLDLKEMDEAFQGVLHQIEGMIRLKKKRGFDSPPIMIWPAAALYLWARRVPWEELLLYLPIDEGDLASLIMRTADHLRQVMNLKETHPQLASVAQRAIELIMREPVYIDPL